MPEPVRDTSRLGKGPCISPDDFRKVMGRFATGVTLVTTMDEGRPHGMTANAVTSVSLVPPLVLVCVSHSARTHLAIRKSQAFCINILAREQTEIAQRFAGRHREMENPFSDLDLRQGITGVPILSSLHAYVECRLEFSYDGGDHTIFVGRVVSLGLGNFDDPLLFHGGQFKNLGKVPTLP